MRATSGGDIGKHTPGAPDRSFWEASCFLLHQRIIFSSSSFVIGTPSTPVRLLPFTKPAFSSPEPGATPWMTSPRRGSTCNLKGEDHHLKLEGLIVTVFLGIYPNEEAKSHALY